MNENWDFKWDFKSRKLWPKWFVEERDMSKTHSKNITRFY